MTRRSLFAILVVLTAASLAGGLRAQETTCGCDCRTLIDADGNLNPNHCDTPRVLEILDRYGRNSSHLLPERVGPDDIELLTVKLDQLRGEVVEELLGFMTFEDLDRFLPVLTRPGSPSPKPPPPPGGSPGNPEYACDQTVFWINEALDEIDKVDQLMIVFAAELGEYNLNPATHCSPTLVSYSIPYANANVAYNETRQWLQYASGSMSNQFPSLAKFFAYAAWWRGSQTGFGYLVAYNHAPISGDVRCDNIANFGLGMAPVAQAARQAYEWADKCSPGGLF